MKRFLFSKHNLLSFVGLAAVGLLLSGCSSTAGVLSVRGIGYQAVNTKRNIQSESADIPSNATILTSYAIDENGRIAVFVKNLSEEIIVIDQEMSFFINTDGISISYFDPTIRTESTTDFSSTTSGATFNFGALAYAVGLGGPLGTLMGGFSSTSASTTGSAYTSTVTIMDQKKINIGPRGTVMLSKTYKVAGLGAEIENGVPDLTSMSYNTAPLKFSICIYYSDNEGRTFKKLVTDFYVSNYAFFPVVSNDKVNDTLRSVMNQKPDLFSQPWSLLYFKNNIDLTTTDYFINPGAPRGGVFDTIIKGMLFDYQ